MIVAAVAIPLLAASLPAPDVASVEPERPVIAYDLAMAERQDPESPLPARPDEGPEQPAAPPPIVVTGRPPSEDDPAEEVNVASFEAVQAVDAALIEPITNAYTDIVPEPVRKGLHNVLKNLDEPVVFLNFLLQLKPGKALETLVRFTINSTLGLGGLIDVAKDKPFNLPRRSNGFADTLGYYGVGPGPYLYLPLIGPTTVRDLLARPLDLAILPTAIGKPFNQTGFVIGKGVLSGLDERDQMDETLTRIRSSTDPYLSMRKYYLERRKAEIEVLQGKRSSVDDPAILVPAMDTPVVDSQDPALQP